MPIKLVWKDGGEATLVQTDGANAVVDSTRAAPPGTPLVASLALGGSHTVRLKVQDCRKNTEQRFTIRGRWLDLPRALREALLSHVTATA